MSLSAIQESKKLQTILKETINHPSTEIHVEGSSGADKETLFRLYNSDESYKLDVTKLRIVVPDFVFQEHLPHLETFFEPFIDKKTGKIGINSINKNAMVSSTKTISGFLRDNVIRAVLLLGAEEVSKLLVDWKNGKQITCTSKFHYLGVNVDSPLFHQGDRILPPKRGEFETVSIDQEIYNLNC